MSVYEILKQLESTASTNEKQAILERNKDNELLKESFRLMLDTTLFYIDQIDPASVRVTETLHSQVDPLTLIEGIKRLEKLTNRTYTGNEAKLYLNETLNLLSSEDENVLMRIVKKDPNCGVSDKTVNKVWKNLVAEVPYMRCDGDLSKVSLPCLGQIKSDGMFANIVCDQGSVVITSRSGKFMDFDGILEKEFERFNKSSKVLHGELLVLGPNGKPMDRKTGNGLLTSVQRYTSTRKTLVDKLESAKTAKQADKFRSELKALDEKIDNTRKNTIVNLWDCVDFLSWKNKRSDVYCFIRFEATKGIVEILDSPKVNLIGHKTLDSLEEVNDYYEEAIAQGEEGIVVKTMDGPWESGNSKDLIKVKAEEECDLICYDVIPHSKNPSLIGALRCMSGDGILKVDVGTGLSAEDREKPKSFYLDKVMTIRYNEKIKNKQGGHSLFLPRLVELDRTDHKADVFVNIK